MPCECPPRRRSGAGDVNAATTTSSTDAASSRPPNVRYSFETPSRSTSRIRPQAKSSDQRHRRPVGQRPALTATAPPSPSSRPLPGRSGAASAPAGARRAGRPAPDRQEGPGGRGSPNAGCGSRQSAARQRGLAVPLGSGRSSATRVPIPPPPVPAGAGERLLRARRLARSSASRPNRSHRTSVIVSLDGPCSSPERCVRRRSACSAIWRWSKRISRVAQRVWARSSIVGKSHDLLPGHVRLERLLDPSQDAFDAHHPRRSGQRRQLARDFVHAVDADRSALHARDPRKTGSPAGHPRHASWPPPARSRPLSVRTRGETSAGEPLVGGRSHRAPEAGRLSSRFVTSGSFRIEAHGPASAQEARSHERARRDRDREPRLGSCPSRPDRSSVHDAASSTSSCAGPAPRIDG